MFATTTMKTPSSYVRYPRQYAASKQSKSINNIRFNWFMMGSVFGLCASMLLDFGAAQVMQVAVMEPSEAPKTVLTASAPKEAAVAAQPVIISTESLVDTSLEMAEAVTEPATSWFSGLFGSEESEQASIVEKAEKIAAKTAPEPVMTEEVIASLAENSRAHVLAQVAQKLTLTVGKGDTMLNMLTNVGVGYDEAMQAVAAMKKTYDPRKLRIGQDIAVTLSPENDEAKRNISQIAVSLNKIESVMLNREEDDSFHVAKEQKELTPEVTYAGGTITNSLFETGYDHGVPNGVLAEMVKAYSYDVDFQRQIQRGDQMEVLFEKMTTEDGEAAGYGKIFYAELKLRGEPISIYRFEDKDGSADFFNENGESVRKALLKTPIDGARISSSFGYRKHPILGYSKLHTGTDFAARTGTPIYASGDGVIAFKGRKGGYGNYIQIKHNGTYQSAYAHMSKFGRGMSVGKRVKQGDVIGYVGTTGRSTGPHLHYEVIKNGSKVNPLGEKFKAGRELKGTELAEFKREISRIKQQVAGMMKTNTRMASAQ